MVKKPGTVSILSAETIGIVLLLLRNQGIPVKSLNGFQDSHGVFDFYVCRFHGMFLQSSLDPERG